MIYKKDLDYVTKTVLSTDKKNEEKFVEMANNNSEEAAKFMKDFRSIAEEILMELFKLTGRETPNIIRGLIFLQDQLIVNPTISYSLLSMIRWFCYFDYYREVASEILAERGINEDSFLYKVIMSADGISITDESLDVGTNSAINYLTSSDTYKYYNISGFDKFENTFTEKEQNIMYMLIHYVLTQGTNVMDLISKDFTNRYDLGEVSNQEAKEVYNECVNLFKEKKLYLSVDESTIPFEVIQKYTATRRRNITPRRSTSALI